MSVIYNPINWQDGENGGTPIDATNLNHMEQGIVDAVNTVNELENSSESTAEQLEKIQSDYETLNASYETLRVTVDEGLAPAFLDLRNNHNDLNDYVRGTQESKISNLESSVASAQADISNLIGFTTNAYSALSDEIQLKADRIENSASGHFLAVNDMAKSSDGGRPIALSLYGKATQDGTSGKNLLQNNLKSQTINGVTITVNNDGSFTATGTASAEIRLNLNTAFELKDGQSYTLSGAPSGGSMDTYYLACGYVGYDTGNGATATITEDKTEYVIVVIKSGVTINKTFYPMIRLSSVSDATYEPYTGGIASPNPNYPQEVTVAGADGDIALTSCGKNILNIDNTSAECIESISNGAITFKGALSAAWYRLGVAKFVKGQTYTITGAVGYGRIGFGISDTDIPSGTVMSEYTSLSGNTVNALNSARTKISFVANKTFTAYVWYCSDTGNTGSNASFTTTLQIEVGSESTAYTRYAGNTATIPTPNGLAGIPVESGGNYTDGSGQQWICDTLEFTPSTGNGTIDSGVYVQRVKKLVVTGNESFSVGSSGAVFFTVSDVAQSSVIGMCSHSAVSSTGDIRVTLPTSGDAYVRFFGYFSTAEEFANFAKQEYANGKPITIYYPLAEPITTELTSEQISAFGKIHTFYPVTNVFTDDIGDIGIEYVANTKAYIDSKFNELTTAILSAVGSEG